MRVPPIAVLALVCLTAMAGCLAALDPQTTGASAGEDTDRERRELTFAPGPGPTDRRQVTDTLTVPDRAEGLAFGYELTLDDAGEVEAWLTTPDEDEIQLTQTRTRQATTLADTVLLEPHPGEWTIHVDTSAPGQLAVNLTIQPRAPSFDAVDPTGRDRPVVAVVDTGVNPYHEVFRSADLATSELPERVQGGDDATVLQVPVTPEATYRASLAADAGLWANVPDERLVHFAGTNLLGYQLDGTELPQAPVLDQSGHGTGVSHAVTRDASRALVVMVTGADYDEGVEWAAQQEWIDVISLSWGPVVNAAGTAEPYVSGFQTPDVTRMAHDNGKLVVAASGSDPTATVTDTATGPPWVHAVSGAQPNTTARAAMSGNLVDTVANWTQPLADHESRNDTGQASGTSFATPTTAGIAAHVLDHVRQASDHEGPRDDGVLARTDDGPITNTQLRSALNRSAVYWNTTDYGGPSDPGPSVPVAPTPWVSMGWGYLDGSRVPVAAGALLGDAVPDKPAEAEAWMDGHQRARETYWASR